MTEMDRIWRGKTDDEVVEAARNLVVAFLEAAGITSTLRGESTTKTHGSTVDGLGRVEVVVAEEDEDLDEFSG